MFTAVAERGDCVNTFSDAAAAVVVVVEATAIAVAVTLVSGLLGIAFDC